MTPTASGIPSRHGLRVLTLLAATLTTTALVSTSMGFVPVSPGEVLLILQQWIAGSGVEIDPLRAGIITDVRLPRIATALVCGFGLGTAGAVFQALLLNPLADPFTLGVSSGAAFGASLSLLLGLTFLGPWTTGFMAFAGAALTLAAVLGMTARGRDFAPSEMILAGIIVSTILSAGISFMKYLADDRVASIVFWLMGSFVSRTWIDAAAVTLPVFAGWLVCMFLARDLNILSLGGRTAATLGVNASTVRPALLLAASLMSAACVSVSGIIGFVGLIVPHLMRLGLGPDNRMLIPASGLGGAILLLFADTLTRAVLPAEVPVGVLTALIGGPVFCWLFAASRGRRHG